MSLLGLLTSLLYEQVKHVLKIVVFDKKKLYEHYCIGPPSTKILAKNQSGQAVPHMYDDNDVE